MTADPAGRATIYHNPRCSKSRQALELLRERGVEPTVIKYLDTPPDVEQLRTLIADAVIASMRSDGARVRVEVPTVRGGVA